MLAVPRPREGGLRRGENVWLRLTTACAQCLRLIFFSFCIATIMLLFVKSLYFRCLTLFTSAFASDTVVHVYVPICVIPFLLLYLFLFSFFYHIMVNKDEYIMSTACEARYAQL